LARGGVPPWISFLFIVGVVLIALISFMGGDPTWVANVFTFIVAKALPGIVVGAIAWGIATALTKSIPLGVATGAVTFVIYLVIRLALSTS